jgi:hypothetical protein
VETLFSRELPLILAIHQKLLLEIKQSERSFIDSLSSFIPYLKTYTLYINNFSHANKLLVELSTSNQKFQEFVQEKYTILNEQFQKSMEEESNKTQVDLRGLLIMPIQRLPRYELLLKDLAKYAPTEQDKLAHLLTAVQNVNQHINESKRKEENTEKLAAIQNSIRTKAGEAFTLFDRMGRKFVREGRLEAREMAFQTGESKSTLKKLSGFNRYYFFLCSDLLIQTKPNNDNTQFNLKQLINLQSWTASTQDFYEGDDKDRIFCIACPEKNRVLQFKASSSAEKGQWMDDLTNSILSTNASLSASASTPSSPLLDRPKRRNTEGTPTKKKTVDKDA